MHEAGLEVIDTYITFCQNTIYQYITTRQILELCLVVEQHMGARFPERSWEKGSLDLEGVR